MEGKWDGKLVGGDVASLDLGLDGFWFEGEGCRGVCSVLLRFVVATYEAEAEQESTSRGKAKAKQ